MKRNETIIGKKFNRWTVVEFFGVNRSGKMFVLCKCECGTEKKVDKYNVISGASKSCGCFSVDMARNAKLKHGLSWTKEYSSWRHMKDRCENPGSDSYKWYGGAGVSVYKEWSESFESFYKYIGAMPEKGMTLDRINPYKGYEPGNVRWATWDIQARNKKPRKSKTGVIGVCKFGSKFRAYASKNNKSIHLGVFESIKDAITARRSWEYFHGVTELELLEMTKEALNTRAKT